MADISSGMMCWKENFCFPESARNASLGTLRQKIVKNATKKIGGNPDQPSLPMLNPDLRGARPRGVLAQQHGGHPPAEGGDAGDLRLRQPGLGGSPPPPPPPPAALHPAVGPTVRGTAALHSRLIAEPTMTWNATRTTQVDSRRDGNPNPTPTCRTPRPPQKERGREIFGSRSKLKDFFFE